MMAHGPPGLREPLQRNPNVFVTNPLSKLQSKKTIAPLESAGDDQELVNFMGNYKQLVYVSFGTTFMPSEETVKIIFSAIEDL
jgi:UDP:flavonoid glycosyltransferase YjiC (YdhE family)